MNLIQEVYTQISNQEYLKPIDIKIKQVRKGMAWVNRKGKRKITIPKWAIKQGLFYSTYYIIHELTHFICYDNHLGWGHSKNFLNKEKDILRQYDLIPKYKKVYVKELYNLNNKLVWKANW